MTPRHNGIAHTCHPGQTPDLILGKSQDPARGVFWVPDSGATRPFLDDRKRGALIQASSRPSVSALVSNGKRICGSGACTVLAMSWEATVLTRRRITFSRAAFLWSV